MRWQNKGRSRPLEENIRVFGVQEFRASIELDSVTIFQRITVEIHVICCKILTQDVVSAVSHNFPSKASRTSGLLLRLNVWVNRKRLG